MKSRIEKLIKQADSLKELSEVAEFIIQSGFAPSGVTNPKRIIFQLDVGEKLGVGWLEAVQGITVLDGVAVIMGDLALNVVMSSGLLVDFEVENNNIECTVKARRKDHEYPISFSYSIYQAAENGLKNFGWQMYPERMIYYRALSYSLRSLFPDLLGGLHIYEEMESADPKIMASHNIEMSALEALKKRKR